AIVFRCHCSSLDLLLLLSLYVVTGLGITVGFHRLFTHRSFETFRSVRIALAIAGSMSLQAPVIQWCTMHRRHTQYSDCEGDPHSPHLHGEGFLSSLKGLWHSHVGWLLDGRLLTPDLSVSDLSNDSSLRFIDKTYPIWAIMSLLIPTAIGGIARSSA